MSSIIKDPVTLGPLLLDSGVDISPRMSKLTDSQMEWLLALDEGFHNKLHTLATARDMSTLLEGRKSQRILLKVASCGGLAAEWIGPLWGYSPRDRSLLFMKDGLRQVRSPVTDWCPNRVWNASDSYFNCVLLP